MQIQIPGYSIVSTLSRGAVATVYLAWDTLAEREVALKVTPLGDLSPHPETIAQERERLIALKHPNIVAIYDVGIYANNYFVAMQYLPGYSLNHQRFELDLLARLRVVADIAHALDFASERDCVHAALTPDNVIVSDQNNHAVLLGFGNVQADANAPEAGSEKPGLLAAAHFYSPEQLHGHVLDGRADLYSLGIILFLLLTDDLPFKTDSLRELQQIDREQLPSLPDYLKAFEPIVHRLLRSAPALRYQRARECIADLGALPESALVTAAEGVADLLMREEDTPLETMAKLESFTAYNLFASRMAEQDALVDANRTIIVPNKLLRPLARLENESDPPSPSPQRISLLKRKKLVGFSTIFCGVAVLIYFAVERHASGERVVGVTGLDQTLSKPITRLLDAVSEPETRVVYEPSLQDQATILRAQLSEDFSRARDLVIIYRAALRGEDAEEHAFAHAGLSDLQQLFSERIQMYLSEDNQEAAATVRDLAEQLFNDEEILPELTDTLSSME